MRDEEALKATQSAASIVASYAELIALMEREDAHSIVDEIAARAHRLLDEKAFSKAMK